ncbi:hypothetical protein [Flavobacterium cyanobacteriorum]|nr:hypothetical protein [Flavobacterium cyanobacteriorum]
MKRKSLLVLGAAALLVLITSCGPKRYGCNKRRCIVDSNTKQEVLKTNPTKTTQNT